MEIYHTIIDKTSGDREIRYGIDPVLDIKWIETYMYTPIPEDKIQEIKTICFTKLQALLQSI